MGKETHCPLQKVREGTMVLPLPFWGKNVGKKLIFSMETKHK
jgi:hypothetical protein